MRIFSVIAAMKFAGGPLCAVQLVEQVIRRGSYAAPLNCKGLRYLRDASHFELSSVQEIEGLAELFEINWRDEVRNAPASFAEIVAAGAFPDRGTVNGLPSVFFKAEAAVGHVMAIDWESNRPRIKEDILRFYAVFESGIQREAIRRIYDVSLSMESLDVWREEVATYNAPVM